MPEFLLSVVGSAVIGGLITLVGDVGFNQDWNYFLIWFIVFCAWWGFFFIDGDLDW